MPIKGSVLDGVDALYSIIQMPPGIPVAVSYTHLDVYKRQVYQFGDKVNAWLNGMYKTRFQRNGKTLALTTELRTLRLTVVTCLLYTSRCV